MKKSLVALSLGTLALGITEYVMMGILPFVADYFGVSIATAGHLISAYALGVVFGAPLLAVVHKFAPKTVLLSLGGLMLAGALLSVAAPSYGVLLVARFISGLPHGAYFGVASIVAVRLSDEGKGTSSIAVMIMGMCIANMIGVPLCTALSESMSWRMTFALVACVSALVIFFIHRWVPRLEALPDEGFRSQFRFLKKREPWLILIGTLLCNCGIFCWYSYVSPVLSVDGGFSEETISSLMILAGGGMVLGNGFGGKIADRFGAERVTAIVQFIATLCLTGIFFFSGYGWVSVFFMVICTACLFGVSAPQQFMILQHAEGGQMLGGATIQIAFNLGNAIGAFCGGLPIEAGLAPHWAALTGIPFTFAGCILMTVLARRARSGKGAK